MMTRITITFKEQQKNHTLTDLPEWEQIDKGVYKMKEEKKMTSIKQAAEGYVPEKTLNIVDLKNFAVDLELKEGEGKDKDEKVFKYKYITVDEKDYRIPTTVIGQVKALLEKMPGVKILSATKTGEGLATRYNVFPYQEAKEEQVGK